MAISLDADDVRDLMSERMRIMGKSQKEYAALIGVSTSYLCDVMRGAREPGKKILDAHGLTRAVYYEFRS